MTDTPTPPIVHLVVSTGLRALSVHAAGTDYVRTTIVRLAVAHPDGSRAELTGDQVKEFIDDLAETTGYYPTDPSLDAQRETIRAAADELRRLRDDADDDRAALVDLALHRHVGENLADAARLVIACRDHMGERVVAEMASELSGLLDAIGPIPITNQDERIAAHDLRIQELREQLPKQGRPSE